MHTQSRWFRSFWVLSVSAVSLLAATDAGVAAEDGIALAAKGTPVIDGKIDALWSQTPLLHVRIPVDQLTSLPAGKAAVASVRALWDDDHLYFLFQVTDRAIGTSNGAPWEQDSVEIFLDENLARKRSYDDDDGQYRIGLNGNATGNGTFRPKRVVAVTRKTVDGYVVEASIKPTVLRPHPGAKLGLELQVNDDPAVGSRKAVMKWSDSTDNSWRDTSQFGTLHLRDAIDAAELRTFASQPEPPTRSPVVSALAHDPADTVPDWVTDALFYQVFPERFCNGDPSNDPVRASLEFPDVVPDSWTVSPWTGDWYARAAWEQQMGDDFYDDGVFHRRYGGDLQGVIDKLDYLRDLGINAIYLNPVFYARSLHKYDGNSFHHVDPYFGPEPQGDLAIMARETSDPETWQWTAADKLFLKLIDAAHQRGIRIVIDGVFNHTGRDFFAFEDLREKQEASPYRSWYIVEQFDDPATAKNEFRYKGWWGVDTLPEFANIADGSDLHPGPKKYVMDATRRWMDPNGDGDPSDGLDGWRLDVANEVPNQFWVDWHALVRTLNPQAYTVSEIWNEAADYLRDCGFSATMNYHGFAFPVKGFLIDGTMQPSAFARQLDERRRAHHPRVQYALQNLLDSHDTDRLASMVVNAGRRDYLKPERFDYDVGERVSPRNDPQYDVTKPTARQRQIQRLAALFQMTFVGTPMIYYGTEAGMWGGDDPCDRMPMVWPELEYERQKSHPRGKSRPADEVAFDADLFAFYRAVIGLRHRYEVLRRGDYRAMLADDDADVFAFVRENETARLLVVLNRSESQQTVQIDLGPRAADGQAWQQVFTSTGGSLDLGGTVRDGRLQLTVPPLFGVVLAKE
jgi:glycosidase